MKTLDCKGSTNLTVATYDEDTSELTITFTSGKSYIYEGVPPAAWDQFGAAPSKGSFFAQHIRPSYATRLVQ